MDSPSKSPKNGRDNQRVIVIEHPNILFFALNEKTAIFGRPITGVVVLVVQQEDIDADNITLRWEGKEITSIDTIREEKSIFVRNQVIWKNDSKEKLKKGTHTFYFNYQLPENYPSSFSDSGINTTGAVVPRFLSGLPLPNNPISSRTYTGSLEYSVTAFVLSQSKEIEKESSKEEVKTEEISSNTTTTPSSDGPDSTTPLVATPNETAPAAAVPFKGEQKYPHTLELSIQQILSNELETPGLSILLSNKVLFDVAQRFEKDKFPTDKIERTASKSSYVGHSPVEVKASVLNGGVSFRGHFCVINLAILNGTSRILEPINLTVNAKSTFKCQGQTNEKTDMITTGRIAGATVAAQGFYVHDLLIDIPAWLSPSLNSQLLQRSYEIVVEVPVPYATGISVSLPIVVLNPSEYDQLPERPNTVKNVPPSPKTDTAVKAEEKKSEETKPEVDQPQKTSDSAEEPKQSDEVPKVESEIKVEGEEVKLPEDSEEKFEDVVEEPTENRQ